VIVVQYGKFVIGTKVVVVIKSCRTAFGDVQRGRDRRDEMPVYDFVCEDCGPFEQQRSFAEAGNPMKCPSCGREARRVYSMPNTKRMSNALSGAMNRAEKSAHEPEVAHRPVEGKGSGKKHHHNHERPWMIGH
jgi:putative FmdB family regulatory protein